METFRNNGNWSYVDRTKTRNSKGQLVSGTYYVACGRGTSNWYNKSKYGIKTKAEAIKYAKAVIR